MTTPEFTDAVGRRFHLVLTYGLAEAIERELKIDLANAHNGEAWQRLAFDNKLFVQTLTMLCEKQLAEQRVSPADFVNALDGPTFEAAGEALEQMVMVFIRPQLRPIFQEVLKLLDQVKEGQRCTLAGPAGQKLIAHELAAMEQRMAQTLTSTPTNSPGSGPASSASVPARTPSGNSSGSPAPATCSSGTTPPA